MSSPIASSSTSRPAFFGLFDRSATPSHEIDVEAQLAQPAPAFTHASRATRVSVDETTDAIDDFFGAAPHRRGQGHHHHHRSSRMALPGARREYQVSAATASMLSPGAMSYDRRFSSSFVIAKPTYK